MIDEGVTSTQQGALPTTDVGLSRGLQWLCVLIGLVSAGAGAVAVFETDNHVGSAALLALGVYFLVTGVLGHFPRLVLMGNEIDPRALRQVKEEIQNVQEDSDKAKINSEDVVEGLADTRRRVAALERSLGRTDGHEGEAEGTPEPPVLPSAPEPKGPSSPGSPDAGKAEGQDTGVDPRLLSLASKYNETRWTMRSGPERTSVMTGIVDQMIAVSRETVLADPARLLEHEDRGMRLGGIAYLYARPDVSYVADLAKLAITSDKPFNEYWALLALRKTLRGRCEQLTAALRRELQERLRELPPSSDRVREIKGIMNDCP